MTNRKSMLLTSTCGILGTVALILYFTAPNWLMPLPPPEATFDQIAAFGREYRKIILLDTWLQQIGSFLSVLFTLSLVHLGGFSNTLAGKLTLLVSGVILSLSLAEGTFALGALYAAENGHHESTVTCFGLTYVFIHIFLLAPSLFLVMGFAIRGSNILPSVFSSLAIVLGALFQFLGVIGLFNQTAIMLVIFTLIAQNLWTLSASLVLILRKNSVMELKGKVFKV